MLIAHLQCCGTKSVKNCVSRSSKWIEREDRILHLKHRGMCLCVSHGFTWKLYPYRPLTAYDDDNDDNSDNDDDEDSNNKALSSNSLYHSGWEYWLRNELYSSNEWCIPYAMLSHRSSMVYGTQPTRINKLVFSRSESFEYARGYAIWILFWTMCAILFSIFRFKHNIAPFVSLSCDRFFGVVCLFLPLCSIFFPSPHHLV